MKPTQKPLSRPKPNRTTADGEPNGTAHLNQDRLRALEEARIAHLPDTIIKLEKRIVSLHRQPAKAEKLLAEARKEWEGIADVG